MQNPEGQEALTGTRKVEIKALAIIRTVEGRAVGMGVARILSKDEDLLRSLQQVVHGVRLAVALELAGQIILKAVHRMARLVQAEARIILKVVLAISSSMGVGNSMAILWNV
jgi:hypothetical protein